MNRLKLTLTLASLGVAGALAGCLGENKENPLPRRTLTEVETTESRKRPTLAKKDVEQFGFQLYWDLPIRDEVITSLTIEGDQLYAFTKTNRLYQIDMHSGMINWVYDVGRPISFTENGRPISEFVYKAGPQGHKEYDEIFFVAQDYLYSLDKKNGSEFFKRPLTFNSSSPPQASRSHVFIGSWDDRIYAIRKDLPEVPDWYYRTGGDILNRPAFEHPTVFVNSRDGKVHTFDGANGEVKGPFKTDQSLRHDALIYRKLMYLPADDHNLYVVGTVDGILHHRECANAPLNSRPVAISKTIYFGAEGEGMFALQRLGRPSKSQGNPNKVMHKLLWQRKESTKVLAKGVEDIYMLEGGKSANQSNITRLNAKTGNFRDTLSVDAVDYFVTNEFDPKDTLDRTKALRGGIIILGYRNGWIIAIKEKATIPGAS